MTRTETTKFLGKLLTDTRLGRAGSHWASEVSIDPWTPKARRVDYMEFSPANQYSVSGIDSSHSVSFFLTPCRSVFCIVHCFFLPVNGSKEVAEMRKRRAEKMLSARRQRILQGRPSCLFFLTAVGGLHALLVVEDGLSDTQILRRDLQQLVVRQELQALLQAHLPGRHQAQSVIGAGGTGVGLLLFLAERK